MTGTRDESDKVVLLRMELMSRKTKASFLERLLTVFDTRRQVDYKSLPEKGFSDDIKAGPSLSVISLNFNSL